MGLLKPTVITFFSILALAWLLPVVSYANWTTLIAASLVLTLLQKLLKPILGILFLPINLVTLGLFSWVINVFILWLVMAIVPGFHINQVVILGHQFGTFMSLAIVSFVLGFIQSLIDMVF